MHHGVAVYRADELLFLGFVGQLAVEQQVTGFQVVGLVRKLLDRVASVQQYALVAVDEGDL